MKRLVTPKERQAYSEALEFIEAFVDYYCDDEPVEPGEETDAQRLAKILPTLKGLFGNQQKRLNRVIAEEREKARAESCQQNETELKDKIYMAVKEARESVNPNYKYCVCDGDIYECWLTDDIGAAMQKAHTLAVSKHRIHHVLKIYKAKDGTYKTTVECCYYDDGSCIDRGDIHAFLHFDFIAQKVGDENIHKI